MRIRIQTPVAISGYVKKTKSGKSILIKPHIRGIEKKAQKFKKMLAPITKKIEIAGSIRRGEKNPKDIDLVVIPKDIQAVKEKIKVMKGKITSSGKNNLTANIQGTETNIFFANKKDFSSQLLHRTGPKGSAIRNRILARQKGYILNQYGLFDRKTGKLVASTAHDIYHKLGKTWRAPSQRGTPR